MVLLILDIPFAFMHRNCWTAAPDLQEGCCFYRPKEKSLVLELFSLAASAFPFSLLKPSEGLSPSPFSQTLCCGKEPAVKNPAG